MSGLLDEWSLKEYHPADPAERWFFRKNLKPNPGREHSDYRYVAYLTLYFESCDETGLPDETDEALLFEIEETGLVDLELHGQSVHVASVLKNGVKDLLFYTRDPRTFLEQVAKFRDYHSRFPIEYEVIEDPSWEHYADFP
jgi:hypothetical protein